MSIDKFIPQRIFSFYIVPADTFEAMLEKLDDLEIARIVKERKKDKTVRVSLDEL